MNVKENDQIPNSDVFVLENGDPIKKKELIKLYAFQ